MASFTKFLNQQLYCSFYSTFFFLLYISIFSCAHIIFSSFMDTDKCEPIPYPQPKTKITYYDSAHKIDKEYLYTHVAKPILQNFVISVELNENASSDDKKVFFSKQRYFMKVRGNWSEYPLKKLEDICIGFLHVPNDKPDVPNTLTKSNNSNDSSEEKGQDDGLKKEEPNYCENVFSSSEAYVTCYKENNYAVKNLFLYFEISVTYLKALTSFYNVPVVINSENDIIYLTNSSKKEPTEEKENLNLHVCYHSSMEKDIYLGKVTFNAHPLNVEKNLTEDDNIYTHSFLTNNWNYNLFVNGKYLTSYNRLSFINIPRETNDLNCGPFWDYAVLGAGPSYKQKKSKENFLDHSHKYVFSNVISDDYFIPFFKNDELKSLYKYILCLYSDENDFEGMPIKVIHFSANTTDSVVLILLIIFIIVFFPIIFYLTALCVHVKITFLNSGLNKLQLMNRKDEIEERLKTELNLEEYEISN